MDSDDERLVLREWRASDASELALQANEREVWLGLRDAFPHPYGLEDAQRFIALARGMTPRSFLAIEVDGRIGGGIGYSPRSDVERVSAEVGYWLGREFRGRGLATRALRLLCTRAFETLPELRRLYAVPYSSNQASARVLDKAGFLREGTLRQSALKAGRLHDQHMYALLREDWERAAR
jgi:RimJ/RimL family protein N-acetyltransferase